MMSIVSALTGYQYDTFLDAFNALQEWLIRQEILCIPGLKRPLTLLWHLFIITTTTSGVRWKSSAGCSIISQELSLAGAVS